MVAPSLALIPTGFKDGKLYSVLPESGVGDFDVVRGSGATRVNKEGLVVDVRILSGELITNGDFSNGSTGWTLGTGCSIGNNKAILTNGTDSSYQIFQGISGLNTKRLKVTFDISNFSGSAEIRYPLRHNITANGSYSFEGIGDFDRLQFQAKSGATTSFDITNISVKEITEDTNIPRIDYTDGGCPSLLLEPQSTNLVTYSEDFSDASWAKSGASVVGGFSSPSGGLTAYKMTEDTSNGTHRVLNTQFSFMNGDTYNFSCFAKKGERDFLHIRTSSSATFGINSYFDLANGVVGTNSSGTASIENYGNGWYRCSIVGISSNTGGTGISIYSAITDGSNFYQGDGTSGVYIWGAQLEALPYATSYIPTSGAIATRLADSVSGAGDATTFNSNEGVLYVEMAALADDLTSRKISLNNGASNNQVTISYDSGASNRIKSIIFNGGVISSLEHIVADVNQVTKVAFKYKSNDCSLWVNGAKVDTDTSSFSGLSLSKLSFNNGGTANPFYGKVKDLRTYNTALTDAELTELTTI